MQQPMEGFPIHELRKPQEGLRELLAKCRNVLEAWKEWGARIEERLVYIDNELGQSFNANDRYKNHVISFEEITGTERYNWLTELKSLVMRYLRFLAVRAPKSTVICSTFFQEK